MATHSNILAWRIPGTEEPNGLPSMGLTESDMTEATWKQQQHSPWGCKESETTERLTFTFSIKIYYVLIIKLYLENTLRVLLH